MPTGEGFFIHQRRHTIVPIFEHATHLYEHPEEFGLDARALKGLNPLQERDREALIIAAGMNGWARVQADKGRIGCELWAPWRIVPPLVRAICDHAGAGPLSVMAINNLRFQAGLMDTAGHILRLSDSELRARAMPFKLNSQEPWDSQIKRARRIRMRKGCSMRVKGKTS